MDLAQRFSSNPILAPQDVPPSAADLTVECLLNPGAFRFGDKIGLLMRVAERRPQREGILSAPVCDEDSPTGIRHLEFALEDPDLQYTDPRLFTYAGVCYLTTLSHLRLAWSDDGRTFAVDPAPALTGRGPMERFGVEDSRVSEIEGEYHLTYTAVSEYGVAVAMATTRDWTTYARHGILFPPANKDCALFEEKVNGQYVCLHRPEGKGIGGPFIWLSRSPDRLHWGEHACIATTRYGMWDEARVGAGAAPIRTDAGWLAIYHGADRHSRYCLGALLLDASDPSRVLARSREPTMEPVMEYEQKGFFGNVVFTNGHVVEGDEITLYYGASDTVICGATMRISDILESLR